MTDLQRIKKVIKWFIFSGFGDNEKEIAEILGYTKSSFSQILNGKVPISDKFVEKILQLDNNINKVWVLTGKESMFNNDVQPANNSEVETLLREKMAMLEKNNALLEENKALLQAENERLKAEIQALKSAQSKSVNQFNQPSQSAHPSR